VKNLDTNAVCWDIFTFKPKGMDTGLLDIDGGKIRIGDTCKPVKRHYSMKKYKNLTATLVWRSPMLTWLWSDGYLNPVPVMNPQNFRIIESE
jgi:hypothetical protein